MALQRTPYTPYLLLIGGLLTAFAASLWYLGHDDESPGARLGGLLMLAGAAWVFLFTAQLSSTTLAAKVFWRVLTDATILSLMIVWLAYVRWYTGRSEWLSRRAFGLLALVPGSLLAVAASPSARRILFSEVAVTPAGSFVVLDVTYAPLFLPYLTVGYALLLGSLLLLASVAIQARGIFRWQIAVLLSFATLPGCAVLVDLLGYDPVPGLDLGPVSIAVTAVAGAFSVARFKWLDLTPIARDQVFRSMTDAVVVFDGDGRIVDLNPPAERIVGDSVSAVVGRQLVDLIPALAPTLDTPDAPVQSEVSIDTPDGERVFDLQLSPIPSSVGNRAGYALILHDITARKAAEDRADRRSHRTEQLLRVVNDLTAARTVETVFQRAVDGGHDVFDADVCRIAVVDGDRFVPAASSIDEPVDDLPPQPMDAGFAGLTYRAGRPVRVDDLTDTRRTASSPETAHATESPAVTHAAESPTPTYRSLLSAPIGDRGAVQLLSTETGAFDEDDCETVTLFASHVATALDRAEAESDLRDERDRLEEFASVVAHDLRNPLTIATGRLELLADAPDEHVEPLGAALERMETIITDILTLARRGDAVGDIEPVDLSACVADAWATVDTDAAELCRADDLGHVPADRGRLQELFENLFRNSVEHGSTSNRPEAGDSVEHGSATPGDAIDHIDHPVTVRVGTLGDADGFYVADDGPGIPANRRKHIFEYGHSSADDGTGIGLSVVEQIVRAHGWEITVTDADGGGARFEITVE